MGLALLSGLQALTPWRYALKRIGGRFGSSVISYFLFLKTLLAFNALLLPPLLAFLVGVQAAFPPPASPGSAPSFTGLELLTGGVRARSGGGRLWAGAPPSNPLWHSFLQGTRIPASAGTPGGGGRGLLRPALTSPGAGEPQDGCGPLSTPGLSSLPLPCPLLALPLWAPFFCLRLGQGWAGGGSVTPWGLLPAGQLQPHCPVLRLLQ